MFIVFIQLKLYLPERGIVVSEDDKLLQFIKRFTIYDRFEQKMKIGKILIITGPGFANLFSYKKLQTHNFK